MTVSGLSICSCDNDAGNTDSKITLL